MTSTRKTMQKEGWKAFHIYCQDPNGGIPLVKEWHVLLDEPRAGELTGGHATRREAWRAAEDGYEIKNDYQYVGSIPGKPNDL